MKTKYGYETNGTYLKYKCGFTGLYKVDTENDSKPFFTEESANHYILTEVVGCDKGYADCPHYIVQEHGCYKCAFGNNKNVINL